MRIGIDGFEANVEKRVGIGQYAYNILCQLHKLDKKNNYTIFLPTKPLVDMPLSNTNWRYIIGKPQSLWTVFGLPQLIKKNPVDIFFSPTHYSPWFIRIPKIISIMDLSYLKYPQLFRARDLWQLRLMGGVSIKRAQKILTISEFSKSEIIEHYHYPKNNIVITYPGVNIVRAKSRTTFVIPAEEPGSLKNKIPHLVRDDGGRYILFVGTIQPRKNLVRLIKAFELSNINKLQLVLVGKKGWLYEPIFKEIEKSPKKAQIKWLDFVSDEELTSLYKHAACFVLPSLYEGFGIPVVEAMKHGCPVVVANMSSLPEVAGDAGIYIDPLNIEDIARGLKKAVQLTKTERKGLIQEEKIQANKFTWNNCAKKTLEVFESFKI